MITKADAISIQGSIAKPSKPSVRLTALDDPTNINIDHGTKSAPKYKLLSFKNGTTDAKFPVSM